MFPPGPAQGRLLAAFVRASALALSGRVAELTGRSSEFLSYSQDLSEPTALTLSIYTMAYNMLPTYLAYEAKPSSCRAP